MNAPTAGPDFGLPASDISNRRPSDIAALREAGRQDLPCVNAIVAAAIDTWHVSERVKRISLPLYQYHAHDLEHLQILIAETAGSEIAGIAAIEAAEPAECPHGLKSSLLHGIYVDPQQHRNGIGSRLLEKMESMAGSSGFPSMLVKARPESVKFFEARGFVKLPTEDHRRHYPYRYWKQL
ncbi:MAG: GNAT family N-acetyltransferase [Gammaproteobacteria bacterium]|nr:MAG: GNAT family N-acetyltransferase [Gammaproteobacteria bacterium]